MHPGELAFSKGFINNFLVFVILNSALLLAFTRKVVLTRCTQSAYIPVRLVQRLQAVSNPSKVRAKNSSSNKAEVGTRVSTDARPRRPLGWGRRLLSRLGAFATAASTLLLLMFGAA